MSKTGTMEYCYFSASVIWSSVWWFHTKDNGHCYPFWPPSFLSSLSMLFHTRYRNHFLCVASFHYTLNYSHSCPSLPHFLFPSFFLLSFLLSSSHIYFPLMVINFPSIQLYHSIFLPRLCVYVTPGGHHKYGSSSVKETHAFRHTCCFNTQIHGFE